MDTRTKIISAEESAQIAARGATVVSGAFDPLTAPLAERLKQFQRPLLVLISDPPNAILPALARAHLVAGLAAVDFVAVATPDTPKASVHLETEHAKALAKLIEHVHSRQQAAG